MKPHVLFIYMKRQLKSPAFIVSALLALLLLPLASALEGKEESVTVAGYYTADATLANEIQGEWGGVTLVPYGDYDALARDVENRSLICGYLLPEDVPEAIRENEIGSITRLVSPATVLTEPVDEALFTALAKACTGEVMALYLQDEGVSFSEEDLRARYGELISSRSTTYVEYEYTEVISQTEDEDSSVNPLPYLTGIYLMIGALLSVNIWIKDRKRGIPGGSCNVLAAIILLAAIGGGILVYNGELVGHTALRLVLYALLLQGFSLIIGGLCRSTAFVCGLLPVAILGSLGVCPIVGDLTAIVPALKYVAYVMPPYYMGADITELAVGAAVYLVIARLIPTGEVFV